jgi:hypothetical protein
MVLARLDQLTRMATFDRLSTTDCDLSMDARSDGRELLALRGATCEGFW